MPRTISENLKAHIALNTTTVNHLWTITRTDSQIFRFTDCDVDIVYDGNTYATLNSGGLSSLQSTDKLDVDNFDFEIILDSASIAEADIRAGKFDLADVTVWLINRESVTDGVVALARGVLGESKIMDDNKATIEFRSLTQLLDQVQGRVYTHECDATLGDARCKVNLNPWTVTGSVTTYVDNRRFEDSSRTEADNWFNKAILTWTSGDNDGLQMEIKDWSLSNTRMFLYSPMPFTIQVGDTYSTNRGCSFTRSSCKNRFDNIINFQGFPDVPGFDKVSKVPDVNEDAGLHD